MPARELTSDEYLALRSGAEVTAADEFGDKVLKLRDGTYLKLFRIKRLVTSARIFPYWKRFHDNAEGLARLDIPTLRVREILALPTIDRTAVHYDPLPGITLRESYPLDAALAAKLGEFIRTLHDRGIYLRSMHLGNVILTPEGDLGLIDIADMRIFGRPLSRWQRTRNFRHLCRYVEDRRQVASQLEAFLNAFDERDRPRLRRMFLPDA